MNKKNKRMPEGMVLGWKGEEGAFGRTSVGKVGSVRKETCGTYQKGWIRKRGNGKLRRVGMGGMCRQEDYNGTTEWEGGWCGDWDFNFYFTLF